jgi:S1-C subfamily serine protease
MNRKLDIFAIVQIISLAMVSSAFAQDCSQVFTDYRDATVYIHVERTTNLTGAVKDFNGTGIVVSPDGYVLTNNHVVEHPSDVDKVDLTGAVGSKSNQKTQMLTIAQDPSQDLALLQIANSDSKYKFVPVDFSRNPPEGTTLCSMGYPMDQDLLITKGILSSKIADKGWWLTDMSINPGDSGAPVFDTNDKIIAVAVAGITNAQNLNFMIPIFRAKPILGYLPPAGAQSTQKVEPQTPGFFAAILRPNVQNFGESVKMQVGGSNPKNEMVNPSNSVSGSVTAYDGFKFYAKSTYNFETGNLGPWGAQNADIGVATPSGQEAATFFIYYDAPPYTNTKIPGGMSARAGIGETEALNLNEVLECPSSGYSIHYFQPEVGRVYCVRTRDGHHYAKIRIYEITDDRITFDYVYQPSGSRKFNN